MKYANRSRTKPTPAKKNLNLVPNAARKKCRKPICREYCSAFRPLSPQSRLSMLNNTRISVITMSQVQAGKAPEPKKICTDGKQDTLKTSAPSAIPGSISNVEAPEGEYSNGWVEAFFDAELASVMMQSELELDEGFSPEAFEALPSLDEVLPSQPNSSAATPTAEGALPSLDKPPASQRNLSHAAPAFEALPSLHELLSSQPNPSCAASRAEEALNLSLDKPPTSQRDLSHAAPAFEALPSLHELLSSQD